MSDTRRSKAAVGLFVFLFLLCVPRLSAAPPDQLGKVNFPTTCSAVVQPAIEKGVALMHSFQYKESEQTFSEAATRDPKCAMAYWGKAMALYHQFWDFPTDETLKEGRQDIEEAQKLRSVSPREKGFITAAAAFFGNKSKMSHVDRRKAYSAALERFYAENPGDSEIGSFYALSLVTLAEEDVDTTANLKKAISILDPLLKQYPDHPGIAHYLIHATDRPEFASQGLEAARRYAAIAPDSSHALHMPSHIFVRLGLWQDSITSNLAAVASAAKATQEHRADSHYQFHAMHFLDYSYLQSGEESKAEQLFEDLKNVPGASPEDIIGYYGEFEARHALELHHWKQAATLPIPHERQDSRESVYRVRAIGAARRGHAGAARAYLQKYVEIRESQRQKANQEGYQTHLEKTVPQMEAEAWVLYAEGKPSEALKTLRSASEREEADGVDSLSMPAREMLADMLLELKRPAEALAEYKAALRNSPNRFDGLLGAARAAQASGDSKAAQSFYAQLTSVCAPSADRPELAEAKTVLAQK